MNYARVAMIPFLKTHPVLQDFIDIVVNEGRIDQLIKACSNYHYRFYDSEQERTWKSNFAEFIGRYYFGENTFAFTILSHPGMSIYFIGNYELVRAKIYGLM